MPPPHIHTKWTKIFGGVPGVLGGGADLSFIDGFDRADGAIGNNWTGATWTIASNVALNTPTPGEETVANGTFDENINNWIDSSNGGASISWNPAGALSLNGVNASERARADQQIVTTAGRWYRASRTNGGTQNFFVGTAQGGSQLLSTQMGAGNATDTFLSTGAAAWLRAEWSAVTTIDNISVKSLSSLFAYQTLSPGPGNAQVKVLSSTTGAFIHGGLGLYVDDDNYVIAYTDVRGGRIRLLKRVAGTPTVVANVVAAFSTGAMLEITRAANNLYSVAYNDSVVISSQAISDAVFDDANKWCLFATDSRITFNDYAYQAL